jgi:hypothetical protein
MTGVFTNFSGKKIAGALTAIGLVLAPVALYADASAPWVGKPRVMKHKAKHVMHKRKKAVRSVRRTPRAPKVMEAAPEPTYTPPPEPTYTPPAPAPEPVYIPPPVLPVPAAPAPVAAAPAGGGGFPILAVLGGLAAIGGIVAIASGSKSP